MKRLLITLFMLFTLSFTPSFADIDQIKLSAEQGDADAQLELGIAYYLGEAVRQDYAEAVKWFKLAAEQGKALAQFQLGAAYDTGRGAPQDYIKAVKWYRLSAEQGNEWAQFFLGRPIMMVTVFVKIMPKQ